MADTQNYRLKGHLGSFNSFIDPPSEPAFDASKITSVPKSATVHKIQYTPPSSSRSINNRISHSSATSAPPSSSTPLINSSSSSSSETPFVTFPPGVIYTGDQQARKDTTFKEDGLQHHHSNKTHINWFYPLLAVLGILAILTLAIYFYVEKKRRRASIAPHRHVKWSPDENQHPEHQHQPQQENIDRYPSWSNYSIATTNTLLNTSKSAIGNSNDSKTSIPPPAYTPHTKQEKRLTSDTLVEPASMAMLKTQYSPQLAFSPSLVAGEFQQQQQQETEAFPTELLDQKNLVATAIAISPSNTLIDNSSILSASSLDKKQQQQNERPRIEIYDPQINIPENDEEEEEEAPVNPFNPYHSNNKEDQNSPPNHLSVHVSLPNVYENEK